MLDIIKKRECLKRFGTNHAHISHRKRKGCSLILGQVVDGLQNPLRFTLSFWKTKIEFVIKTAAPTQLEFWKYRDAVRHIQAAVLRRARQSATLQHQTWERMPRENTLKKSNGNGARQERHLGFEATLWVTADKLRGDLDAAEYNGGRARALGLGLIFLKYIFDACAKLRMSNAECRISKTRPIAAVRTSKFGIRTSARPSLKGVLPKEYARPHLDKQILGGVIDLVSTIGLGDKESRSKDIIGRVYEYLLSKFASAEGKKGDTNCECQSANAEITLNE